MLWPWPAVLDHSGRMVSLSCFILSKQALYLEIVLATWHIRSQKRPSLLKKSLLSLRGYLSLPVQHFVEGINEQK